MSAEVATAALLVAVPIAFNLAFLELGRAFDYPDILRQPALSASLRAVATRGTLLQSRLPASATGTRHFVAEASHPAS